MIKINETHRVLNTETHAPQLLSVLNYLTDSLTISMVLCSVSELSNFKMNPTLQGFSAWVAEKISTQRDQLQCRAGRGTKWPHEDKE